MQKYVNYLSGRPSRAAGPLGQAMGWFFICIFNAFLLEYSHPLAPALHMNKGKGGGKVAKQFPFVCQKNTQTVKKRLL
jgi:hypothetical protein